MPYASASAHASQIARVSPSKCCVTSSISHHRIRYTNNKERDIHMSMNAGFTLSNCCVTSTMTWLYQIHTNNKQRHTITWAWTAATNGRYSLPSITSEAHVRVCIYVLIYKNETQTGRGDAFGLIQCAINQAWRKRYSCGWKCKHCCC